MPFPHSLRVIICLMFPSTVPTLFQEAFQALLNVMERNFAALTLPGGINSNDNRSDSSLIDSKRGSPLRRAILQSRAFAYFHHPVFDENFFGVSQFVATSGQEIGGVIQVIFPVSRTFESIAWAFRDRSASMENIQKLNVSNEPMEIEEISYTESIDHRKPVIKQEKLEEVEILKVPENAIRDSRPKVILRKSKLTGLQKIPWSMEPADSVLADEDFEDPKQKEFSKESEAYQKTKAKLRPLVKKEPEISDAKKTSYFYFWQLLFFILFPVAVMVTSVTIVHEDFSSESCTHRFNAVSTMRELKNRIFGQAEAIRKLDEHLTPDFRGFKVLAIIGGSGVGKSYTAHIISENFQPKKNVFHYVQPLEPVQRHAALALSLCGCNLVVLENLGNKDISAAAEFVRQLRNAADNYCVFVIEVINVQETDDNLRHIIDLAKSKSDIENIYQNKKLDVEVVVFKPLDDEDIKKCILEAARSINVTLSDSDIDYVRLSLRFANSGCKGAHSKVHLLDKKIEM